MNRQTQRRGRSMRDERTLTQTIHRRTQRQIQRKQSNSVSDSLWETDGWIDERGRNEGRNETDPLPFSLFLFYSSFLLGGEVFCRRHGMSRRSATDGERKRRRWEPVLFLPTSLSFSVAHIISGCSLDPSRFLVLVAGMLHPLKPFFDRSI